MIERCAGDANQSGTQHQKVARDFHVQSQQVILSGNFELSANYACFGTNSSVFYTSLKSTSGMHWQQLPNRPNE